MDGLTVVYKGGSIYQKQVSRCTNPDNILEIGEKYKLVERKEHSWHTRYVLEGFEGMYFNSVLFEYV